jgi:hypothetical protein
MLKTETKLQKWLCKGLFSSTFFKKPTHALYFKITLFKSIQLDEQRKGTHNSTNRNTATCPGKVVPRNNNKADSSSATGTIPLRMVKVNDRNM